MRFLPPSRITHATDLPAWLVAVSPFCSSVPYCVLVIISFYRSLICLSLFLRLPDLCFSITLQLFPSFLVFSICLFHFFFLTLSSIIVIFYLPDLVPLFFISRPNWTAAALVYLHAHTDTHNMHSSQNGGLACWTHRAEQLCRQRKLSPTIANSPKNFNNNKHIYHSPYACRKEGVSEVIVFASRITPTLTDAERKPWLCISLPLVGHIQKAAPVCGVHQCTRVFYFSLQQTADSILNVNLNV